MSSAEPYASETLAPLSLRTADVGRTCVWLSQNNMLRTSTRTPSSQSGRGPHNTIRSHQDNQQSKEGAVAADSRRKSRPHSDLKSVCLSDSSTDTPTICALSFLYCSMSRWKALASSVQPVQRRKGVRVRVSLTVTRQEEGRQRQAPPPSWFPRAGSDCHTAHPQSLTQPPNHRVGHRERHSLLVKTWGKK